MSEQHHHEARRLLALGYKICELKPMLKQPVGDAWNKYPVTDIRDDAGGYGLMLPSNGLCSVDPDNVDPCVEGFWRCGFDLDDIMAAGVRSTSTRPGSGGRATFLTSEGLSWITFRSKKHGTICELRATSENLQDALPGTVYRSKDKSGPWVQAYATERTLDQAGALPADFMAWWRRMSGDLEYLHEQQRLFVGGDVFITLSSGSTLAFASHCRVPYNEHNEVVDILERHNFPKHGRGRYSSHDSEGAPGIRAVPGKLGLWRSDHGSGVLANCSFDAWTAHVALDYNGDVQAAETAWALEYAPIQVAGFTDEPLPANPLPSFQRINGDQIKASKDNVVVALARPDVCGFQIRHDAFKGETMMATPGTEGWRRLEDIDYTRLCLQLERGKFLNISKDLIRDSVAYVAASNQFDSAAHWLGGLRWDGVPRVRGFLTQYLGAADTPYTRAVGEYLWTAMAGRVLQPGCKADMVPVLVGAQGVRKTSAVAALVPAADFFTSLDLSLKDDDQTRIMRGKLVIELGELRGLATRDSEHIKAFITRTHEEWVPKYMELPVRYPRRCVFVGTSNKDDFLADETGERRWLPFHCGQCDPDAITRDRDQLWAEARELFMAQGVMFREAERLAGAEHGEFTATDSWENDVLAWLHRPDFDGVLPCSEPHLTAGRVLSGALGVPVAQQSPSHQSRLKKVLIRLGYRYVNSRVGGVKSRRYEAPLLF